MAFDLGQFSITRTTSAQLTVPRWTIEFVVINPTTGAVTHDFTGANALVFPTVLGQLTNAQQDELVEHVVMLLIKRRAGIE